MLHPSHKTTFFVLMLFSDGAHDFSKENMDKLGHGVYEPLDVNLLPPPHLIYAENPNDSGKVNHME
ncbi:Glucuronokinase [Arachis hypogaea]|nr:Glucuronokinase [Arachis hypogaea]